MRRSLLRLALAEVETRASFPAFSEAVLTLLNSRAAEATTDLPGLENVADLEHRGDFTAVASERSKPWRPRGTE